MCQRLWEWWRSRKIVRKPLLTTLSTEYRVPNQPILNNINAIQSFKFIVSFSVFSYFLFSFENNIAEVLRIKRKKEDKGTTPNAYIQVHFFRSFLLFFCVWRCSGCHTIFVQFSKFSSFIFMLCVFVYLDDCYQAERQIHLFFVFLGKANKPKRK